MKKVFLIGAIVFVVGCVTVSAASPHLVFNNIKLYAMQSIHSDIQYKSETSPQFAKNSTSIHNRLIQSRLMGNLLGKTCLSAWKSMPYNTWIQHGDFYANLCGVDAVNEKGFINIRTSKSYSDETQFWGSWITEATFYNEFRKLYPNG